MSKLTPELDSVYVCSPLGFKTMVSKSFSNYPYMQGGVVVSSGPRQIHRYAKDYEIDNTPFTMIVLSEDTSEKNIEKLFDDTYEKIKADNKRKVMIAQSSLIPTSLDIKHGDS